MADDQMPGRPGVDVVVPFHGTDAQLEAVIANMTTISLGERDSLVIVDNGPPSGTRVARELGARSRVVVDAALPSSYYARNVGAAEGGGDWILFVDADVEPPADLIERYFERAPDARDGVLAGGVRDQPVTSAGERGAAARYAHLRAAMSQTNTLVGGEWSYAQTANCAVRRAAFVAVGGFRPNIRSGGDADLCFRIRRAGWELTERSGAAVVHRSRPTLRAMLRQRARHGSGARWLHHAYPGSYPPEMTLGTLWWSVRQGAAAVRARMRGDRDTAILLGVEVLSHWAFQLGRLAPNRVRPR